MWSMKAYPVWLEGIGPTRPNLKGINKSGVAIVGGSFAGLSTAYHLLEKGCNGSRYFMNMEDSDYLEEEARIRNENGFPCEVRSDARLGDNAIYLLDKTDASVNPAKFCTELAGYLEDKGVRIYENSPVRGIGDRDVYSMEGKVRSGKIILSGQNVPSQFGRGGFSLPSIETYCMATEPLTQEQIEAIGTNSRTLFWDGNMPYIYGKLTEDNRLLVGGGDLLSALSPLFAERKMRQL
ncbi:MAG: FAD-dependent oxidoreductase [Candidatus Aenigmarchaeota archaeon]|nr:FAD-dependent oxidoreductase [Candidatus Aenigmarchaeota archaeon]MDI6722284.1 FAD-dependent oxidoreductase [Candidatus Aenigmarchaeota archaeon]